MKSARTAGRLKELADAVEVASELDEEQDDRSCALRAYADALHACSVAKVFETEETRQQNIEGFACVLRLRLSQLQDKFQQQAAQALGARPTSRSTRTGADSHLDDPCDSAAVPGHRLPYLGVSGSKDGCLVEPCELNQVPQREHAIVGHEEITEMLAETIILPQKRPDLFTGIRQPLRTILLHGPAGSGKTMLAQSLARESSLCFITASPSSLLSKWVGESERALAALFTLARNSSGSNHGDPASNKGCVLFFDEVDSFALDRRRDSSNDEGTRRLLIEMLIQVGSRLGMRSIIRIDDGSAFCQMNNLPTALPVIVVAATNAKLSDLDPAFVRRFEVHIRVPLPSCEDRVRMVKMHLTGLESALDPEEFAQLAQLTEGFSGSDLRSLSREAAMIPVRECTGSKSYVPTVSKRESTAEAAAAGGSATADTATTPTVNADNEDAATCMIGHKRQKPATPSACVRCVCVFASEVYNKSMFTTVLYAWIE